MALAQVIGTGLAIIVVDKYGRRILLILSDSIMCISILVLGVFFYLKEHSTVTCTLDEIVSDHAITYSAKLYSKINTCYVGYRMLASGRQI